MNLSALVNENAGSEANHRENEELKSFSNAVMSENNILREEVEKLNTANTELQHKLKSLEDQMRYSKVLSPSGSRKPQLPEKKEMLTSSELQVPINMN